MERARSVRPHGCLCVRNCGLADDVSRSNGFSHFLSGPRESRSSCTEIWSRKSYRARTSLSIVVCPLPRARRSAERSKKFRERVKLTITRHARSDSSPLCTRARGRNEAFPSRWIRLVGNDDYGQCRSVDDRGDTKELKAKPDENERERERECRAKRLPYSFDLATTGERCDRFTLDTFQMDER